MQVGKGITCPREPEKLQNQMARSLAAFTLCDSSWNRRVMVRWSQGPSTAAQVPQGAGTTPDEIKPPNQRARSTHKHLSPLLSFFWGSWGRWGTPPTPPNKDYIYPSGSLKSLLKNTSFFRLWEGNRFHKSPSPAVPVSLTPLNVLPPNARSLPRKLDASLLLSSASCPGATYGARRLHAFKVCLSSGIASPPFLLPSTEVRKDKPARFLGAVSSSTRLPRTRMRRKLTRIREKRTMDAVLRTSTHCGS